MNPDRIQKIHDRLTQALSPSQLEIIDDSHKHKNHIGAQNGAGHFTIHISSPKFTGKNPVQCHRLIYEALGEMMGPEIHALKIKIL